MVVSPAPGPSIRVFGENSVEGTVDRLTWWNWTVTMVSSHHPPEPRLPSSSSSFWSPKQRCLRVGTHQLWGCIGCITFRSPKPPDDSRQDVKIWMLTTGNGKETLRFSNLVHKNARSVKENAKERGNYPKRRRWTVFGSAIVGILLYRNLI